jgi:type II secretory pathway pseudopilin PulG
MKKVWWITNLRGFLLVEILLASSVFIIFMAAFSGAFYYGIQSSNLAGDRARAIVYAEEGQEAVRSIKNTSFSNLTNGTYGLVYSSSSWQLTGTPDTSGIFTRTVTISSIDSKRKKSDRLLSKGVSLL